MWYVTSGHRTENEFNSTREPMTEEIVHSTCKIVRYAITTDLEIGEPTIDDDSQICRKTKPTS